MMAAPALWPAAARAALLPSRGASTTGLALSVAYALSGAQVALNPVYCKSRAPDSRALKSAGTERDVGSILAVFSPLNFSLTCMRNALICYMPLVEQYFRALEEAARREEEGELVVEPVQFPDASKANDEVTRKIARDFSVQITRRILARYVKAHNPARISRKLLKDLPMSARRKAERAGWLSLSRFDRSYRIGATIWRGNLVSCLSELMVQFSIVSYDAWSRHTRGDKRAFRRWVRRSLQALARFGAVRASTAACVGAAMYLTGGTTARTAYWTAFGGFAIGDVLANTWVNSITEKWVAQA